MTETEFTGRRIGYARVSTADQDHQLQIDALTGAGVEARDIFKDTGSGKSTEGRPRLKAALEYAQGGDVLIVWKVDRLARSVVDLINTVDGLAKHGIGFKVLTGALSGIDTTTPDGRLFLTIVGGMAEFERSLIKERTLAGLRAAKDDGRVLGRPRAVDEDKTAIILARRAKGESPTQIAKALGIGRSTVYRALAAVEQDAA
jgi:DNA invertase Pin-like site-specific DNA recombinase